MNIKTKAKILSTIITFSALCSTCSISAQIAQNPITYVNPSINISPTVSNPRNMVWNMGNKPLTPEKKLEFQKQNLDLKYEKSKLYIEKKELNEESQKIKDELKGIFDEIECGQDHVGFCEQWQTKLDRCLEKRKLYREKLMSYQSRRSDWLIRKTEFDREVTKYEFDKDLSRSIFCVV